MAAAAEVEGRLAHASGRETTLGGLTARQNERAARMMDALQRGGGAAATKRRAQTARRAAGGGCDNGHGTVAHTIVLSPPGPAPALPPPHEGEQQPGGFQRLVQQITGVMKEHSDSLNTYVGTDIRTGEYRRGSLGAHRQQYLRYTMRSQHSLVRIDLDIYQGEVEMFCSATEQYCSRAGGGDTGRRRDYQWHLAPSSGHKQLVVHARDGKLHERPLYISLLAHSAATFTIKVTAASEQRAKKLVVAHATPSRKVLQQQIDERLQHLKDDPHAMSEFQQRVDRARRELWQQASGGGGGGGGGKRAGSGSRPGSSPAAVRRNARAVWRFYPENRRAHRAESARAHRRHVDEVRAAHRDLERGRVERLKALLKERERRRVAMIQRRRDDAEAARLAGIRQHWLAAVAGARRAQHLAKQLRQGRKFRKQYRAWRRAAVVIQRFVRLRLDAKRRARAELHVQSIRTLVRLAATNHFLLKRHRGADVMKKILEQASGVSTVSRMIHNYLRSVVRLQRAWRARAATRDVRLGLWAEQWEAEWKVMRREGAVSHRVPDSFRDRILDEHMRERQRDSAAAMDDFVAEMAKYHHRLRLEQARRMVGASGSRHLHPPARPHVSCVLGAPELREMIAAGAEESRDLVRRQTAIDDAVSELERASERRTTSRRRTAKRLSGRPGQVIVPPSK